MLDVNVNLTVYKPDSNSMIQVYWQNVISMVTQICFTSTHNVFFFTTYTQIDSLKKKLSNNKTK